MYNLSSLIREAGWGETAATRLKLVPEHLELCLIVGTPQYTVDTQHTVTVHSPTKSGCIPSALRSTLIGELAPTDPKGALFKCSDTPTSVFPSSSAHLF